jgi:hypothetical protein
LTDQAPTKADYWESGFAIDDLDLDFLNGLLLDQETPLTSAEMTRALIDARVRRETDAQREREAGATPYMPKETYAVGQRIAFSMPRAGLGTVAEVRPGRNPELGDFDVIAVDFGDGDAPKQFVARMANHALNVRTYQAGDAEIAPPEELYTRYGQGIAAKLEQRLQESGDLVRLAGRWFPRPLLATINEGHLNLAEAVLDMASGGPLPTEALLKEVGLPESVNSQLQVFSMNYALQRDSRFDEVGPAGQVLWYLKRLEPAEVQATPGRLAAPGTLTEVPISLPDDAMGEALRAVQREIEDEWAYPEVYAEEVEEVLVTVSFPHRRCGTLPLTPRLAGLFPTATVTDRIRFTLVDGDTGRRFPGWVVRPGRYVSGLEAWYAGLEFPVGGQLVVRRGPTLGEVVVQAKKRRPVREWLRTAMASPDGRLAFSMQKKQVSIEFDELTVIAVDNPAAVDEVWVKSNGLSLERLTADVFRELAKLNPQSAVHAKSLYAGINVARRCPPRPLFAELMRHAYFTHVGDAYWRFDPANWTETP